VHPQVADEENCLWILNKESRTAENGSDSSVMFRGRAKTASPQKTNTLCDVTHGLGVLRRRHLMGGHTARI